MAPGKRQSARLSQPSKKNHSYKFPNPLIAPSQGTTPWADRESCSHAKVAMKQTRIRKGKKVDSPSCSTCRSKVTVWRECRQCHSKWCSQCHTQHVDDGSVAVVKTPKAKKRQVNDGSAKKEDDAAAVRASSNLAHGKDNEALTTGGAQAAKSDVHDLDAAISKKVIDAAMAKMPGDLIKRKEDHAPSATNTDETMIRVVMGLITKD